MKKSFAVVGLGRFGTNVALTLMESGAQVLAIDSNPECVKRISSQVTCAVTVNVCETESLKEAGLENMDGVVVAMGNNLEASAMTIIFLLNRITMKQQRSCPRSERIKLSIRKRMPESMLQESSYAVIFWNSLRFRMTSM